MAQVRNTRTVVVNNDSLDTHDLIWTSFDDVYKTLSYDSLKKIWLEVKKLVLKIIEDEK